MPTLNELYRDYSNGVPEYHDHMLNWINYMIAPYTLKNCTIFLEANYVTLDTMIYMETPWGGFRTTLDSRKTLDGGSDWIAQSVANDFVEWFRSLYILPEDNIMLGEN